jgi:cysteinylglycine-S-conjugate dipeptidase
MDCPPVVGSTAATNPTARARLNLRLPAEVVPEQAFAALEAHLRSRAPWGARVEVALEASGTGFRAATDGPAYAAMGAALSAAYGREVTEVGQGGSIPLCATLAETYPEAEIMLYGLSEPQALIHAPNESVDPSEIAHMALAEALFLRDYAR